MRAVIAGGGPASPQHPVASASSLRAGGRAQTAPFYLDKRAGEDKAPGGSDGPAFPWRTSLGRLRESTLGVPEGQKKDRSDVLSHRALLVLNRSHHVAMPSLLLSALR